MAETKLGMLQLQSCFKFIILMETNVMMATQYQVMDVMPSAMLNQDGYAQVVPQKQSILAWATVETVQLLVKLATMEIWCQEMAATVNVRLNPDGPAVEVALLLLQFVLRHAVMESTLDNIFVMMAIQLIWMVVAVHA
jgi:hypothetical protein